MIANGLKFMGGVCLGLALAVGQAPLPGSAQTSRDALIPGMVCQPEHDNYDYTTVNHFLRVNQQMDVTCPIFSTYQYRAADMDSSISSAEISVFDADIAGSVVAELCRSSGSSSETRNCGASASSTYNVAEWRTLAPASYASGSIGDNWFMWVQLPNANSGVHSYQIHD